MNGIFGKETAPPMETEKPEELVGSGQTWAVPAPGSRAPACVFKLCGWEEGDLTAVKPSLLSSQFKFQAESMTLAQLGSHAQREDGVF